MVDEKPCQASVTLDRYDGWRWTVAKLAFDKNCMLTAVARTTIEIDSTTSLVFEMVTVEPSTEKCMLYMRSVVSEPGGHVERMEYGPKETGCEVLDKLLTSLEAIFTEETRTGGSAA